MIDLVTDSSRVAEMALGGSGAHQRPIHPKAVSILKYNTSIIKGSCNLAEIGAKRVVAPPLPFQNIPYGGNLP